MLGTDNLLLPCSPYNDIAKPCIRYTATLRTDINNFIKIQGLHVPVDYSNNNIVVEY